MNKTVVIAALIVCVTLVLLALLSSISPIML